MAELPFDVVEQILVRMDVEDLIRSKSVCKSWLSYISTTRFVKAHLKHNINGDRDNRQLGHRRICVSFSHRLKGWISYNEKVRIVGSSNGLVCLSPRDVSLVVTNPSTREQRELPTPPYWLHMDFDLIMIAPRIIRQEVRWGFGYDPRADDYKVIAGFTKRHDTTWTTFYVLTLKSNTWKVIGDVRYSNNYYKSGILCGGALHWFMENGNNKNVIISLDLSTEKFKEIPLPDSADLDDIKLGVLGDCLCLYYNPCWFCFFQLKLKKWVMKHKKWELYIDPCQATTYDVAHFIPFDLESQNMYCFDDCVDRVPSGQKYIKESIYVKSLVSPHHRF